MHIEVRFLGIERSDARHERVVRRIHFQLSRFAGQISAVFVRIADINGPKGGRDKRCHVKVDGASFGAVSLEQLSSDAYSAVDLSVARAARSVARQLVRKRAARRARPPARPGDGSPLTRAE